MTPDRWQKIERLCNAALERNTSQREVFLTEACKGDEELRREVESLLAQEKPAEQFLESGAAEVAAKVLARSDKRDGDKSMVGSQLGCYQVLSLLGAGGMGEVYRAHDSKLRRNVALKVLPSAFVHDPERFARFQREARVLASLNHPNIATIHGVEHSDGVHYLVMELVLGETLAERISKGALPVEEALRIAVQVAEALEFAHEKGVIHRDLKPANVKVTPEGRVKVLDFGLAKALAADGETELSQAHSPTAMSTEQGRILGTPAYMSPEQARGKTVDKRTDIWAFGCLFFEILSGRPAFQGDTISDTIAAILEWEPAWDRLPAATPPIIRRLLRRCLEKDPQRRLRDMGDARLEIEEALSAPAHSDLASEKPVHTHPELFAWTIGGVAIVLAALSLGALSYFRRAPGETRTLRFFVSPPDGWSLGQQLPVSGALSASLAVSPDGHRIAFISSTAEGKAFLWVRSLDTLSAQVLAGTEGASSPFWSPDSRFLGFFAGGKLKKVGVSGEFFGYAGGQLAIGTQFLFD